MPLLLFLTRHAEHVDYGRRLTGRCRGVGLSERGERQAAALAERLRQAELDELQTSPQERTRQTADAIGAATGLTPKVAAELDEVDFGAWAGLSFDALAGDPDWTRWNEARGTAQSPDGETMAQAADRIWRHAERLGRAMPDARVGFVTHCDMIRGFVARVLGLSLDKLLRFDAAPASVSRVEVAPWGMRLVSLNETVGPDGRG